MAIISPIEFDPRRVPDHFELNRDLKYIQNAQLFWPLHPLRPYEEVLQKLPLINVPINGNFTVIRAGSNGSCDMGSAIRSAGTFVAGNNYSWSFWLKLRSYPLPGQYYGLIGFTDGGGGRGMACFIDAVPVLRCNFINYSHNDGFCAPPPLNEWVHVCVQFQIIWYGLNKMRIWYNGQQMYARDNGPEGGYGANSYFYVGWGSVPTISEPNIPVQGEMRQVCYSYDLWTPEEILRQAREPYEAYIPYTRRRYFFPDPAALDSTGVPERYTPNTNLSWVQKATHIWAVHPSDPLKADKGGIPLVNVTGAVAPPSALPDPENTMEFHGGAAGTGSANNASYYQTSAPIVFGDDPLTAGNQTPPIVGGVSYWFRLDAAPAANTGLVAQRSNYAGADSFTFRTNVFPTGPRVQWGISGGANSSANVTPIAQWVHIVAQHNAAGQRRMWQDGALVVNTTTVTPSTMFDEVVTIGAANRNSSFAGLAGRIRQVAIIQGAEWTDAEIAEMYQRPFAYYTELPPPLKLPLPRLTNAPGLRPIGIKATKATLRFARLAGYAGIRPGVVKIEQKLQLFRLAGAAGLRTVQVKATPKLTFGRVAGAAFLRAPTIQKTPVLTFPRIAGAAALRPWVLQTWQTLLFPRIAGIADLRAFDFRVFRGFWHEELAGLYANQIERERRVLLGKDSTLELYTQRGTASELRKTLTRDFSVYHVSTLAGPEEWFCDLLEDANPWETMREITEIRVKTHGQGIVYKVIALERPVEKGHCYRMRLQATGDPRI